jgi:3',5'-cyclic AMP phosphodiesterase CpdA
MCVFRGSRGKFQRLLLGLFIVTVFAALSCRSRDAPPGTGPGAALIYVTNDVHYLAAGLHDRGPRYKQAVAGRDGKNIEFIDELLQALRYSAERETPDIILLNGDLTYNGERESHRALAQRLAELEALGAAVYVIPGNHDIENPWARAFFNGEVRNTDGVSAGEFRRIYRDFGYGEAVSRDRETLSYVAEPLPKLRLLMLDSNKYKNNRARGFPESTGMIPASTRAWIRKAAAAARKDGARLLAAMHHSIMDHHPMVNEGFTVDDDESLRELLAGLGINFILSGHIHAQDISRRQTSAGLIYDIATSALSVYPHQYGVLRLIPSESRWQYSVKPLDVEAWARAGGSRDVRLLRFDTYAELFFKRSSEDMVRRRLESAEAASLSEAEIRALSDLMGTLNARYFAGTEYLNAGDIPQSEGYRLLETYQFDFLSGYARTIMNDTPPANTALSIPFMQGFEN